MPVFRRRKGNLPRLVPELDDATLGQVRRRLETSWSRGSLDTSVIALVARAIEDAGQDWDRKAHRLEVLAGAAGRAVPDMWRRNSPNDQGAVLLHAWSDLLQAQRGAEVDLAATRDACHLAADLLPADPIPWTLALATLRLERRPHREMSAVWREIKARDLWNREAHLQALAYLSPDECGSTALMLDLLDGIRSVMPPDAPTAGLEIITLVRNYHRAFGADGRAGIGAGEHWRRPDIARALDQAVQDWLRPGFLTHATAVADLNVLAYALVKAARADEALEVLRATNGVATPWPWNTEGDPLERFSHWYGRVGSA
ncbi:hypothetical protein FCH28_24190 [Streptomyces piniterrae]|uniref:DUF4034 domain-containing protein n=1 Tax=Streptomyces piniterrae TaxID=2571125 RepID=A0A4U0N9N7_9ACTN|nr:hypothetical protein [Streptomyces piniterrae]TJZ50373.1 hypothetical protein FCH28_24190 [Streptomyces piniterrae]